MGCNSSKLPDSTAHDEHRAPQAINDERKNSRSAKSQNRIPPEMTNGSVPVENDTNSEYTRKSLKGDLTMYSEAKIHRERTMHERLRKRELQAGEFSERVMEEKEWLSLTSTRSRATSRIGSPRNGRAGNSTITTSELPIAWSPTEPRSPGELQPNQPKKDHSHKVKSSSKVKDKTIVANGSNQNPTTGDDNVELTPQNERNNNSDSVSKTGDGRTKAQDSQGRMANNGLPPIGAK